MDTVDVVVVVVEDAIGFVSFLLLLLLLVLVLVFLFLLLVLLLDDVNQPTAVDVTTLPKLRGAGGGFWEELILDLVVNVGMVWTRSDGWVTAAYVVFVDSSLLVVWRRRLL